MPDAKKTEDKVETPAPAPAVKEEKKVDAGPELPKNDAGDVEVPAGPSAPNGVAVDDENHNILVPGDEGYEPGTDPVIPNSALADIVAAELRGGSSPTRDTLVEAAKEKNKK